MKRSRELKRRMQTLRMLSDTVSAMKSLAVHQLRLCRQALAPAREYRHEIDNAVTESAVVQDFDFAAQNGVLLVVSDLGMCGDYNARLVQMAIDESEGSPGPFYCVGRRPHAALKRNGISVKRYYPAPASVDGLPNLLLQLAEHLLDDFSKGDIGSLFVVSARFEGAGQFSPVLTQVLPIRSPGTAPPLRPTEYQSDRRLRATAVREFLYTTLYELMLDALAAEHGMRLLAAEAAIQWLDETSEKVRREISAVRREATTQEVLDVVAGAKSLRF